MIDMNISESIRYIGVNDYTLNLFENQYPLQNGVTYNSYLILDEKTAVLDSVDERATTPWFEKLERALDGRLPDYLIVSHMEPDHCANIARFAEKYPEAVIVGNAKTFAMIRQFFGLDLTGRKLEVKEKSALSLGSHVLNFYMAPLVHWPEVMVTYEQTEKVLFSADAFGTFGTLDAQEEWADEAARYYLNIVGKFGMQVQSLLKKAAALDIAAICPLHGPALRENLAYYIGKYRTWSSYEPERHGVLIAYASIYGNTAKAAHILEELLQERDEEVVCLDLVRFDRSAVLRRAFYYDRIVLMAPSYDTGLFPPMEEFLIRLKSKNFQKRIVGIVENGSWAPSAARVMKSYLEQMKGVTILEPVVTIRSAVHKADVEALGRLADALHA